MGWYDNYQHEGNCPPEKCGGVYGYAEYLPAWNDPGHAAMREWDEEQGYREYDMARVNRLMEELLKLKKSRPA
jgi:hypothetical protein